MIDPTFPRDNQVTKPLLTILEALLQHGTATTEAVINDVINRCDISFNTIRQRLRQLAEVGWVSRTREHCSEPWTWVLTEEGERRALRLLTTGETYPARRVCPKCKTNIEIGTTGYVRQNGQIRCITCAARNGRCSAGHPWTADNTLLSEGGRRRCLTCHPLNDDERVFTMDELERTESATVVAAVRRELARLADR